METAVKRLYEGLFLVDSALATAQWDEVNAAIRKVLDRAGAEVVTFKKWDERKLAYEVKGKSRGTYILTYFNCDPAAISGLERDVQLSEQILRVMVLKTDRMSEDDMNRPTPAETGISVTFEDRQRDRRPRPSGDRPQPVAESAQEAPDTPVPEAAGGNVSEDASEENKE